MRGQTPTVGGLPSPNQGWLHSESSCWKVQALPAGWRLSRARRKTKGPYGLSRVRHPSPSSPGLAAHRRGGPRVDLPVSGNSALLMPEGRVFIPVPLGCQGGCCPVTGNTWLRRL